MADADVIQAVQRDSAAAGEWQRAAWRIGLRCRRRDAPTELSSSHPLAPPAPAPARPAIWPFISVVVPVRNEERAIANTLAQLLAQDYPADRFEVIVADGESTDDTWPIVDRLALTTPTCNWWQILVAGPVRPAIWEFAARGELLIIVDGHCDIGTNQYLRELAEAFARTGADCLGRPQPLEIDQPNLLQQAIGLARSSRLGHHPASYVFSGKEQVVPAHSVAVAYRRDVFHALGLFDEMFDACEDVELNHRVDRAGMKCVLVPALRVSYHPRATIRGLFRQMTRYGRGRMRLLRKHPETFSPLGFAPAVFLAFVLLGPIGLTLSRTAGWLYAAGLLTYAIVVGAFSFRLAVQARRLPLVALLPIVFATLHAGAGWGVLAELLHPQQGASRRERRIHDPRGGSPR